MTINRIKDLIREIAKDNGRQDWNQILDGVAVKHESGKDLIVSTALKYKKNEVLVPLETCKLAQTVPPKVDLQVNISLCSFLICIY